MRRLVGEVNESWSRARREVLKKYLNPAVPKSRVCHCVVGKNLGLLFSKDFKPAGPCGLTALYVYE